MPKRATLLLVEDEENLGATLKDMLADARYQVTWAKTKSDALAHLGALPFDAALIDVQLPDGSGFEIAEKMPSHTAMLFLTAQSAPEHRVRGLTLGAEDYIVKPFHFEELALRIRNALKRRDYVEKGAAQGAIDIGVAKVDFTRFTIDGTPFGAKEMQLLKLLHARRGKVVSRDEILNHVWPRETYPTARTVDNFVMRLRKGLGDPGLIQSIRGVGYQLKEES